RVGVAMLGCPGLTGLLCDDRVVQTAVFALDPATQRAFLVLEPFVHRPAIAGQRGQTLVIVRQARGRYLVPCCAPEQNGTAEFFAGGVDRKIAVSQPQDIQRHELEVLQVAVSRGKWGHGHLVYSRGAAPLRRSLAANLAASWATRSQSRSSSSPTNFWFPRSSSNSA